jgi:hypothetical protein
MDLLLLRRKRLNQSKPRTPRHVPDGVEPDLEQAEIKMRKKIKSQPYAQIGH